MRKSCLHWLAAAVLGLGTLPALGKDAVWPQDTSDLKPDAKAVWGKLENGLRYVIYPNQFPMAKRASLRLYMNAGSLMEEDDQQGMAHFLEHLAFNGSKHFPPGTMVETFQRLGMGFGADTNAHTSFKETVYKLEMPGVDEKLLTEGFQLFRDDLDGMLLGQIQITKERGVILSEKLARDSIETRIEEDSYKFSMPDALIPRRLPIGLEKTIQTMARPRFVDFYEKWYTPERAIVVVVGDVDVPMTEGLIKKLFDDAKPRRGDSPDPDLGKITTGRGLIAKLHTEMESPATDISIEVLSHANTAPDSAQVRRDRMIRTLADQMLNQRFSLLAKAENTPFISAESYYGDFLRFVRSDGVQVQCKPEQWKASLQLAEQELRRALKYGFTEAEFEEAKAMVIQGATVHAQQKDTRKNQSLADAFVVALASQQVWTDPSEDLKRVEKEIAGITADTCLESFRKAWDNKDVTIFAGGNLKLPNGSADLIDAYKESLGKPVEAPAQEKVGTFAYTDFGPAGKVAKREEAKDLEITEVAFENNVRLNIKKTDFDKNAVRVMVSIGGGKLEAPADKPGLAPFTQSTFALGGLEKHSVDDLRRIFASHTVSADFSVGDDSFILAGKTTPTDFETQLQFLTAHVTAPGFREDAMRMFRKQLDAVYTQMEHTAEGVMQDQVVGFIHSEDFRFHLPPRGVLDERSTAESKAWLTPILKDGYMEVAIVGDIDVETAIQAVAKTFGALPKRAATKPAFTKERAVKMPTEPKDHDFVFTSEIGRAYALAYWPTADMSDIKRTRRLTVLGQVMDDRLRLKIRQELGQTYSPASYHVPSDTYTGYGYMTAMATLKPEDVAKVKPMYLQIGDAIIKEGISEDEFTRAREPLMAQIQQMRRDNRYWLQNVIRNCQVQPERLAWARSMVDDIKTITKEDLNQLAKEYLPSQRALVIGLIPKQTKEESPSSAKASGS